MYVKRCLSLSLAVVAMTSGLVGCGSKDKVHKTRNVVAGALTNSASAIRCEDLSKAVYFGFDSDALGAQCLKAVERQAEYLKQNDSKVVLVGHCDIRGTPEYNLALGMRRAEAVKKLMVERYGVPAELISTESKGKEELAAHGNDEKSHSLNRRVEFINEKPQDGGDEDGQDHTS